MEARSVIELGEHIGYLRRRRHTRKRIHARVKRCLFTALAVAIAQNVTQRRAIQALRTI
jgi:hypothetical protein